METRANYTLIGAFTLAVAAAALAFVFWFSRVGSDGDRASYRVVFDGSVSGLRTGGSVLFNGIKVGEVTGLKLNPENPRQAIATVGIDRNIPVRSDTRANLEYQGLTGIATISLKGGDVAAAPLPAPAGELPTIKAEAIAVQDLAQGARELMGRADLILRRVDGVLADNEAKMRAVVSNLDRFTGALGNNADHVATFMQDAAAAARRIANLSDKIETMASDVSTVVKAVDPSRVASFVARMDDIAKSIDTVKVGGAVDNLETFTRGLATSSDKVVAFVNDAQALAAKLKQMAEGLEPALARVTQVAAAVDPSKVQRTVDSVERFTETLSRNSTHVDGLMKDAADVARKFNAMSAGIERTVARLNDVTQGIDPARVQRTIENVDKFTTSLGQNSQQVDTMLKEASEIARKFAEMTPRVDRILANVEGLTGSADGQGVMAEFGEAAKSVKRAAENLDKRIAEVSAGLARFTGPGLREWETLAAEGRRTLSEVERAVKNLERNPQRVIFGGSGNSVPQYGRR